MARSAVELDFFRREKEIPPTPPATKLFERRRSFRDIQSVISKLNPEILKTVITSGSADQNSGISKSSENGNSSPKHEEEIQFPALPVYAPALGNGTYCGSETAPLTIFYNGTVVVFKVPPHKAENILKLAEGGVSKIVELSDQKLAVSAKDQRELMETVNGDLPVARRKSLQRFLQKRKERLTLASPYGCPTNYAFAEKNTSGGEAEKKMDI